ncbi:hypothetical protein GGF32_005316 [Allomyces javanicus]|nr:hypothetical protein GGF32_005316 [Allomyces javanicus]
MSLTDLDERLIRAIQQNDTHTLEPRAFGEPDPDDLSDTETAIAPTDFPAMPTSAHGGPQTGPKGVMADYKHQQRMERAAADQQHRDFLAKLDKQAMRGKALEDEFADLELDEEDDEVLAKYRAQRMAQMQSRARPTFGVFREIGVGQFLKEVDMEHKETPVLIHLYERYIPECARLNRHLTDLASKYGYVKFLRLVASHADKDFDHLALPTIQVYRGGDLQCNLVRVSDDMEELGGEAFELDDCEAVLLGHGALREADQLKVAPKGGMPGAPVGVWIPHARTDRTSDGEDEDDDE